MNGKVTYNKKKGAKKMTITLASDGSFRVTYPYRVPLFIAKVYFLKNKYTANSYFLKHREHMDKLSEEYSLDGELFKAHTKNEIALYKKEALGIVQELLGNFSQILNVDYQKVSIKNTKSRWGSCSSKKNLAFHYKILFLPRELAEYLVIHELCHVHQMNHSKKFWDLVGSICERHEEKRKLLRSIPCR